MIEFEVSMRSAARVSPSLATQIFVVRLGRYSIWHFCCQRPCYSTSMVQLELVWRLTYQMRKTHYFVCENDVFLFNIVREVARRKSWHLIHHLLSLHTISMIRKLGRSIRCALLCLSTMHSTGVAGRDNHTEHPNPISIQHWSLCWSIKSWLPSTSSI